MVTPLTPCSQDGLSPSNYRSFYAGLQLEVLEPAALLLRQMPRFRGVSAVDVAGRAFEDLSEFLHYRCVMGPKSRRSGLRVQVMDPTFLKPAPRHF